MTCIYGEPGGLTQAPIPAVIYLAEGRGASIVAVSTSGDWPVGTALEWHTDPVLSMPAIIDGTTARWDLTASQVAQVYDSRQARVVVDGGLPRIVAAVLVDYAWTAGGGQALGQVIVGPQGVSVESATVVSGRLMLTMSSGEVIDAGPVSGAGSVSWLDLTDLPTAFPPTAHNHDDRYYTEAEVTTALAGKEATGVAASLLSAHTGATDPHPQYTTSSEAAAAAPVQSVAGKTGDVTLAVEDVSGAVASTDGRLSDPRTPLAHKATHQSGGADALTPADIGAATSAQGAKADAALPAVSYTAADVLAKVTTVDGAGSGLDADTLDGQHASAFATASHSHTLDQTTDTATRVAMTPAERTKLAAQSGTNTGDQTLPVWSTLAGKPPVIAAGADAAAARTAIGAGTSSLVIGTAAGTAADGKALADEITRATAAEATKAAASRQVIAGTGLTGGGDLTADRTLSVSYGTTAGTAAQGNDSRLSDARTPTAHAGSHAKAGSDAVTVTALAAGSTDTSKVLSPDGAGGLAWATPAAAAGGLLGYQKIPAGRYAHSYGADQIQANTWTQLAEMRFAPLILAKTNVFSAANVVVGTAQEGATVRLGVYAADANGDPGALVREFGTVDASTTGTKSLTISGGITLAPGLYFMVAVNQGSTAATISRYGYATYNRPALHGDNNVASTYGMMVRKQTGVTGALPATATPVMGDQVAAFISLTAS